MRVLLSAEVLHGPRTGVQQYAVELTAALARRGDLDLTVLVPDETAAAQLASGVARRLTPMPVLAGIAPWQSVPRTELDGFDLVHCLSARTPFVSRPQARVVMTIHDLIPLIVPRSHDWRYTTYFRHVLPRIMKRRVDHVLTDSEATRNDVIRLYGWSPQRVTAAPLASRWPPLPDTPIAAKDPYFLSVGTDEPRKNLARTIKAFQRFKQRHPEFAERLVIAGATGWGRAGNEDDRDIDRRGYVTDTDLRELLLHARALIYPSLYEGFGLPVLEALALGCPVITSRRGAIPEVAGDAALYVDPDDVESIATAIETIASGTSTGATLARRGLARARLFSWDRCAAETAAVYELVVRSAPVGHNTAAPS